MMARLLRDACATTAVPGAVLALAEGDDLEIVAAGVAAVSTQEPLTEDHQFPPMSITKSMTALLTIEACRRGELALSTPVAEVLPGLAASSWGSTVTVDDLLGCTGGIPAFNFVDTGDGDDAVACFATTADDVQPLFPPGARFSYSNCAYALLAAALEAVTGEIFDDLLVQLVFEPLGMARTGTWYRTTPEAPITQHLVGEDGSTLPLDWWRLRSCGGAGTGTVYATAGDLARYGRAHIVGWRELREPRAAFPGPHAEAWGRGWALYGWDGGVFGWDGFGLGAKTFLRVLPEHDVAIALMTTGSNGRRVYRNVMPRLLSERFGITMGPETWPPITHQPAEAAAVGVYRNGEATVTIGGAGGSLTLSDPMGRVLPLRPAGEHRLVGPVDLDYPTVELEGNVLTYFCSAWLRDRSSSVPS